MRHQLFTRKAFVWGLFLLAAIAFVSALVYSFIDNEKVACNYNFEKKGSEQAIANIDIKKIDYENKKITYVFNLKRSSNIPFKLLMIKSFNNYNSQKKDTIIWETYYQYPDQDSLVNNGYRINDFYTLNKNIEMDVKGDPVLYPFDSYYAYFHIDLIAKNQREEAMGELETIPGTIHVYTPLYLALTESLNEFHFTDKREDILYLNAGKKKVLLTNGCYFELKRGIFLRFLTVYIYSLAFIFLLYIAFQNKIKDLLQGSMGYFAGLWGLNSIITSRVEYFPTLIDYLTLLCFTILLLIILGRLIHNHFNRRFYKRKSTKGY